MRDGQLRLSREAAELADRADRGEAVDADELSGIDRDRQFLWNGLQARDANDQPEDIRCLVPWEQFHKYWVSEDRGAARQIWPAAWVEG